MLQIPNFSNHFFLDRDGYRNAGSYSRIVCVLADGQHLLIRLPLQPQIVCASPRLLAARVPFCSASAGWAWRPNTIQYPATTRVALAAYYCFPALGHLSRAQQLAGGGRGAAGA